MGSLHFVRAGSKCAPLDVSAIMIDVSTWLSTTTSYVSRWAQALADACVNSFGGPWRLVLDGLDQALAHVGASDYFAIVVREWCLMYTTLSVLMTVANDDQYNQVP